LTIIVPRRTQGEIKDPKSPLSVPVLTFFVEVTNGSASMPAARKIAKWGSSNERPWRSAMALVLGAFSGKWRNHGWPG
jgi:hypothetical protein